MKSIYTYISIVLLFVVTLVPVGCFAESEANYTSLQQLAIAANDTADISDIIALSESLGLTSSKKEYKKMTGGMETVYRFATDEDVATQYRPSPGEYISINVDNETGLIYRYEYCNAEILSKNDKNPYMVIYFAATDQYYESGYYIINNAIHKLSDEYIEIKYETAEEALNALFDCTEN